MFPRKVGKATFFPRSSAFAKARARENHHQPPASQTLEDYALISNVVKKTRRTADNGKIHQAAPH